MSRKSAAVSVVSLVVILALMPFGGLASGAGRQPCPNFFWQNPLPQGSNLHDVGAADANTAWAVGDGYTVIKTTDGGRNWTPQDLGFYSEKPEEKATAVTSVSVVNRDVVWICCETTGQTGSVSYIFRTLDGGENWERFTSPAGLSSTGISAISADVAWVACEDNMVFRTTDGGKNWDWYLVPFIGRCSNISALDGNNAWVIGAGNGVRAAVTHDGGQTWDQQQIEKSALGAFDIQAVSNHVAYVSVWNKFKTIDDSGGDWKITTRSLGDINTWLGALSFSDPLNGWIIGENYDANDFFIAKTADSGENWSFLHYPQTYPGQRLLGISALDSNTVWAAGHEGLLIKTDDAGGQWSKFDSDLLGWPSDPTCIESTNEKTAYIAGAGGRIWRTGNGGISWELLQTGVSKDLCALDVLDSRVIWAVGNEGTILKTVDGGRNWSKQASGVSERLLHVSAVSIDVAWASGEDCRLLRTDDGGATWRIVDVGLPPQELCIEALDSNIAWCGAGPGDNLSPSGTVLKTVDGGKSWETQSLPNPRPGFLFNRTFAISIVNGDLAYALAEIVTPEQTDSFGVVFKTTDGGKKWTWMHDDVLDRAYVTLDGMDVAGENIISVCGRFGLFYKSTDGGTSWTYEMTGMGGNLRGVSAIGGQAEWLVGDGGAILRSTTPFVYSVSPDVALNTGTVKITDLEGNGFWDGMDVKLVKSEKEILASNVQVLSPYKATCEFDLEGAEAGAYDVLVFNTNGRSGSLAHGFHVTDAKTWYLPEGSTAKSRDGGFETWVLIENPNRESAKVKVTYMTPGGAVKGPDVTVPPNSRMTIDVSQTVPDNWSVSTRIDADRSVVAEHAMYWDTDTTFRQAAGGSIGLTHTSKEWFLAEGSTGIDANGSFETWVLVQNPGSEKANVNLTYATPAGRIAGPRLELGPCTRQSINIADTVPNEWSVSTTVESDLPIVAERSTYWSSNTTFRQAATQSIGTAHPAREWFLAEGSTGIHEYGGFETWVLVQNPGDQVTAARLYFQTPSGEKEGPQLVLEPHTRQSVRVSDTVPNEFNVSARVASDNPVVAERAMYWNTPEVYRQAAHDSIGAKSPWDEWFIAEGSTGGDYRGGFETWILLQNPRAETATARVTCLTPAGEVDGPTVMLKPGTRQTVNVADNVPEAWSVSTKVVSDRPVIVERATYWNSSSAFRLAATGSIGFGQ